MIKYAIMTIGSDDRMEKRNDIIKSLLPWQGVSVKCVDGRDERAVDAWLKGHPWIDFPIYEGQTHGWTCKRGELGAWLSTINMWEYMIFHGEDLMLVVEDDAIFSKNKDVYSYISDLLSRSIYHSQGELDFISLYVPPNQKEDYEHFVAIDPADGTPDIKHRMHVPGGADMWKIDNVLSHSYQNYSNVAILYSLTGAYKFLSEVAHRGIDMPVDCFVHQISNLDHFKKYAPHPDAPRFVETDWDAPTTIHKTEVIDAYRVYGAGRNA